MAANIYDLIAQNKGMTMTPWGPMSPDVSYKQYTPEEASATFDQIRQLPEFQAQQAGVDELSNELDRLKKLPQVSGDTWVKPLLALADSETGSKLSQGYDENDLSQKRNEMIMKYQDSLLNRKKQQADTLMSGLGKFKSGTTTTKDTGISPSEQAKLDFQKAKQQQDYELELQKLAAQKAKKAKPELTAGEKKLEEAAAARVDKMDAGALQDNINLAKKLEDYANKLETGKMKTGTANIGGLLLSSTGFGDINEIEQAVIDASSRQLKERYGGNPTNVEGEKSERTKFNKKFDSAENAAGLRSMAQTLRDQANYGTQAKENMLNTGYATIQRFGAKPIRTGTPQPTSAPEQKKPMSFEEWKAAKAKGGK